MAHSKKIVNVWDEEAKAELEVQQEIAERERI